MRCLVTGATGFLGRALISALKYPVIALVRDLDTYVSAGAKKDRDLDATLCFGDLSDIPSLERMLAEYRIDTVMHLAAQTEISVAMADPIGTFESNIRGTWNVLEACRRQKTKRIIIASSDKAYGRTSPPYREDLSLWPDRPYETSKACVDLLARTYASGYGMSIATTRCVNLYGPGCLSLSTLVPNTIKRVLKGIRPMIRNGGIMRRDWLYIDDAVDAYLKLAVSDYVGPMNFGSGVGVSVKYMVDTILEIMHSDLKPTDEVDHHGEIVDQWTDARLARETLGWKPRFTLEDGLRKCVEWYSAYFGREA